MSEDIEVNYDKCAICGEGESVDYQHHPVIAGSHRFEKREFMNKDELNQFIATEFLKLHSVKVRWYGLIERNGLVAWGWFANDEVPKGHIFTKSQNHEPRLSHIVNGEVKDLPDCCGEQLPLVKDKIQADKKFYLQVRGPWMEGEKWFAGLTQYGFTPFNGRPDFTGRADTEGEALCMAVAQMLKENL